MTNQQIEAAWDYHNRTKHSVASLQAHQHFLDWEIKPLPFKIYRNIQPAALPNELATGGMPALAAISSSGVQADGAARIPDRTAIARLLHLSAGITRKKTYADGQTHYFRAAACTGALYHIDLYVICGELADLSAGVYHFGPHNFALHQLRAGDYRRRLVEATGDEPSMQHAPVIIACASTFWRNSWKYQARAYRHCFWDCGTLLANLLAVAADEGLPARVVCGFVDRTVETMLDLDRRTEGAVALVAVGNAPGAPPPPPPALPTLRLETRPLSSHEVDYPAIHKMHAASTLVSAEETVAWRGCAARASDAAPAPAQTLPLQPLDTAAFPDEPIDRVILRRGSARRFAEVPISFADLSTLLGAAARPVGTAFGSLPNQLYLIVNAVDGLPPGAYVYHHVHGLELLRAGDFRREAGHLDLGQDLAAEASVDVFVLCDLNAVLERFGNRGYRAAQLDAAITSGKLYLGAYALRLGATGLTFFDDDVTEFFSPHAAGKSVMFLTAIGHAARARE